MEHEKLFDEISTKLQELSHRDDNPAMPRVDRIQSQLRQFQSDLVETQNEFRQRIKSLESISVGSTESQQKLKIISEQLQQERNLNTKLNSDLAQSLEMNLKQQLEIQEIRARYLQSQLDEKKHQQSLQEKMKFLLQDLELEKALKQEAAIEYEKAKCRWQADSESQILEKKEVEDQLEMKNLEVQKLNQDIESLSHSLSEIQDSTKNQNEQMKNYISAAETKISDIKNILDKKSMESQDYYNHLQQALTQLQIFQQENMQLKIYIQKMNAYLEQKTTALTNEAQT